MAKVKKSEIKTWDEVDAALRRMGEIDIAVESIQGNMTLQINELKAQAETKAEGLKKERQVIEKVITAFCEEHKDEFAKTRPKELTFGVVAYRVVTSIVIRSKKACVAALEALNLDKYLRIEKNPTKNLCSTLTILHW
ncbi:MAG: host-nuclease inhibitor Gam family protein [Nitrospirae bacterium]|nr:host-nuclease inhibitor Gam family protein [Nitrospirota bacterium]